MEIEQSALYREIEAVLFDTAKPVHSLWQAQLHVGNDTYDALKVLSIDWVRDYEGKYADEVLVTLAISGGTYAKRLYPNQSNIDITLYRTPLHEQSDMVNTEQVFESERYTATMIDKGNPLLEANGMNSPSEEALNLTNVFEIQFQLANKALEQLRMITVGGIFRRCTGEDVIKAVMTRESQRVKVDGIRLPQGVNMVPAKNKTVRDHVIIPQGTRLVHVPDYIHHKCGGIYSAGMGYYLQGDYWYVYPCYDTQRLNQARTTLTIVNVPKNKLPGVERTYRQNGNNWVVLATGEVQLRNDTDSQQLNFGNGVRFADATAFMESFSSTNNNKTLVSRGANNSEFISVARDNGNNNVQLSDNPINANPYQEYSKLARRQGNFLSLVWENSQPSLIFPGMMVKVLYLEENEIREVEGVILRTHHYTHLKGDGMMAPRHVTNTMLGVFIQKPSA